MLQSIYRYDCAAVAAAAAAAAPALDGAVEAYRYRTTAKEELKKELHACNLQPANTPVTGRECS